MSRASHRHRSINAKGVGLLLLAAVAAWPAATRLAEWRTLTRLRDHGETAPARMTSSEIDVSERYSVDVYHYDFQPAGEHPRLSGVDRVTMHDLSGADPIEVARRFSHGDLEVRYLPDDPATHRLNVFLTHRIRSARSGGLLLLSMAVALAITGVVMLRRTPG